MKGDFSRIRFNPSRHYTSVLEQQGRVSLDADSNEQRAIDEYIRVTENDDIIGLYGAPRHHAGFGISLSGTGIQIGAGRYYVDGLLCENEQVLDYDSQPFLLQAPSDNQLLQALRRGQYSAVQVYLEVWQRLVTVLDDSCLREPALGQADTTARLQTVWRVIAEAVQAEDRGRIGNLAGPTATTLSPCCEGMYRNIRVRTNLGKLSAQTSDDAGDCTCQPTPAAGYRGLENQLYRIEIHQSGDENTATFKWSRENASVVVSVTNVSGSDVFVDSMGPDANLGFQTGQWVELSDDDHLFGVPPNQLGEIYQIKQTSPERLTITMTGLVAAVDIARNPRLRRWEQFGATASATGVPLPVGTWFDLENGIQIQFAAGQYQAGDYWLIPARTASGQIDWPPCGSDGADFQPPQSTPIYRAPLACIHVVEQKRLQLTVDDCRRFFSPLTELDLSPAPPALHVNAISWSNDDFFTLDQLIANGLTVTLDSAFTGHVYNSTFVLTLEIPLGESQGFAVDRAAAFIRNFVAVRNPLILDGIITVNGSIIQWQIPREQGYYALYVINNLMLQGARLSEWTRARVKILGRDTFNGDAASRVFLDGQAYGINALRQDGKTPRIDLQLPTGNADKASDFESWFYLAPLLSIDSMSIQPAAVRLIRTPAGFTVVDANDKGNPPAAVTPTGSIAMNYPALTDTTITLSIAAGAGTAGIISLPNSVTVKAGQMATNFPVTVVRNPSSAAQSYQISASISLAGNLSSSNSAPFSVTGFDIITHPGVINVGPGLIGSVLTGNVNQPVKTVIPQAAKRTSKKKKS